MNRFRKKKYNNVAGAKYTVETAVGESESENFDFAKQDRKKFGQELLWDCGV